MNEGMKNLKELDQIDELLRIQQESYRSASLQSELYTLQKLVMHLKGEIDRVQKLIDETPVGKIMKNAGVK
tara:strand:+ start:524 stop:736 length:213 start_codon:yes stop_codon:yes gene_type:complete